MTATPNPSKLARRALGEIKQAAQQCKDDILLGARVREILDQHDTRHSLMLAKIVKLEADARARKGTSLSGGATAKHSSHSPSPTAASSK